MNTFLVIISNIFYILGIVVWVFGMIDLAGMLFGYDLTGIDSSPVIAGVVGGIFFYLGDTFERKAIIIE